MTARGVPYPVHGVCWRGGGGGLSYSWLGGGVPLSWPWLRGGCDQGTPYPAPPPNLGPEARGHPSPPVDTHTPGNTLIFMQFSRKIGQTVCWHSPSPPWGWCTPLWEILDPPLIIVASMWKEGSFCLLVKMQYLVFKREYVPDEFYKYLGVGDMYGVINGGSRIPRGGRHII